MNANLDGIFNTGEAVINAARDVAGAFSKGIDGIKNAPTDSRRNVPVNNGYGQAPALPNNYDRFVTEYPYSNGGNNQYGSGGIFGNYNNYSYGNSGYSQPQYNGYYGFTDPTYGKIGASAMTVSNAAPVNNFGSIFSDNGFNNGGGIYTGTNDIFGGGL